MSKRKIWLGVGAYVLTSASATALADVQPSQAVVTTPGYALQLAAGGEAGEGGERSASAKQRSQGSEGSEGGEGGEQGALSGLSRDEALLTQLLLMKGHLKVGRELVEQGVWDDAMIHFMHPSEEIYSAIEDDLKARKVPPFKSDLDALAEQVMNRSGGAEFQTAYDRVLARITVAADSVAAETRQNRKTTVAVALALLKQANQEYQAALLDGRLVNVAEYQDSRGFVWTAEELLRTAEPQLKAQDAKAYQELIGHLGDLKRAWPTATAPQAPAMTVGEVAGTVSRIELALSALR